MDSILSLTDFNVSYTNGKNNYVHAVKSISLELFHGDSLGIVGESGSGKSTLAMALLRLIPPRTVSCSGIARFEGRDLMELSAEEFGKLRWKEIAVVFQKSMNSLSPVHRISEQINDIYRVHHPNASTHEIEDRIRYLFHLVNLSPRIYRLYPHELSGGMLQRVSIAISLLFTPKLLILDEATTALDVVTQGQILDEIVKLEKDIHMTRIMITHDISVVAQSCNKIGILYAGELMEIGDTLSVLNKPYHPYTKGLLASFPSLKGAQKKLESMDGAIPDLSVSYPGCIFANRCPQVMEICHRQKPSPVVKDERTVYCHLYGGAENE